eukprot:CAMPEP_0172362920 /NCGR_PEP_ID=MMETSP1060-20121228/6413_1 /TAXON_ID=37318 /ORGANISM="Pseudo-nitzschia pungens, Strain cf. cingulata" /LENGTH=36 /DNA_ID= /DNA_START= /DNA_END= /DNA_ORIENTATION=
MNLIRTNNSRGPGPGPGPGLGPAKTPKNDENAKKRR